mmetsp:Transcript_13512/g.40512  ORF Transcript_13512/g.40512 Transcript_13512/m.40512 type:complete len:221 (+) Transcript_13512:1850-2512(+)
MWLHCAPKAQTVLPLKKRCRHCKSTCVFAEPFQRCTRVMLIARKIGAGCTHGERASSSTISAVVGHSFAVRQNTPQIAERQRWRSTYFIGVLVQTKITVTRYPKPTSSMSCRTYLAIATLMARKQNVHGRSMKERRVLLMRLRLQRARRSRRLHLSHLNFYQYFRFVNMVASTTVSLLHCCDHCWHVCMSRTPRLRNGSRPRSPLADRSGIALPQHTCGL